MSVIIRPAAPADVSRITAIYRDEVLHGTATFEIDPPSGEQMATCMSTIAVTGYPFLVADLDGAVVGYAYAAEFRARAAFRSTVENSVYVAAEAQRAGAGRALLDALVTECGTCGFRQMIAVIGDSLSQTASITLHTRAGFAMAGRLDAIGFKHGRWLDCVLMQRPLG